VYGVPRSTLGDYISGRSSTGLSLGRPPALPAHIERQLVETTQEAAARGFGVNRRGLIEKTGASYWTTAFLLCLLELFFQLCYGFSSLFSFSWCITLRRIFQCSTLPPVTAYFSCLTFRFVTSFFTNVRLLQHWLLLVSIIYQIPCIITSYLSNLKETLHHFQSSETWVSLKAYLRFHHN
jgi:hypothetical protein